MRSIIATLCILLCSSCLATSADLYDMADRFEAREQGLISDQELADALDAKGDEIVERGRGFANSIPTTPGEWLGLLAGLGAAGAATGAGVNRQRNAARVRRDEKV